MADFPAVIPDYGQSREIWRDPILIDVSKAGTIRARRLQPAKKRTFILGFTNLSFTNRNTLETHYNAHRLVAFNFTWPDGSGGPYSVIYANEGEIDWTKNNYQMWDGTIILAEV